MSKALRSLADLRPDPHNANRGKARGQNLLERSLERNGCGRSIVVDKNGIVIAGNKTLETAADLGFEIEVVKTNGHKLVVVQREDLDLAGDDARARELAVADNRTSEVGLDWDADVLLNHMPGVNLTGYFLDAELAELFGEADDKGILATPPDNQKRTKDGDSPETADRADRPETHVEADSAAAAPHDAADEDQRVITCPKCGNCWEDA